MTPFCSLGTGGNHDSVMLVEFTKFSETFCGGELGAEHVTKTEWHNNKCREQSQMSTHYLDEWLK